MEILWNQDPMRTTYRLSDDEKAAFRLKVKVENLEDAASVAKFYLTPGDHFNPERALVYVSRALDADDEDYASLLAELEGGVHAGDCTCFPASCWKCRAEGILGFDSIAGLGKHEGHKVFFAFGQKGERTLDQAIEHLRSYAPKPEGIWKGMEAQFASCLPRWKGEAANALKWLEAYRDAHFAPTP